MSEQDALAEAKVMCPVCQWTFPVTWCEGDVVPRHEFSEFVICEGSESLCIAEALTEKNEKSN